MKNDPIDGLIIFHANTDFQIGRYFAKGGRILNITAVDSTLDGASDKVYSVINNPIRFRGMQYRLDIAQNDS